MIPQEVQNPISTLTTGFGYFLWFHRMPKHRRVERQHPYPLPVTLYRLVCDTCQNKGKTRVYEGETARSVRIRGTEHVKGWEKKDPKNVLYKHEQQEHKHEEMKIKMEITQKFRDPLTRQANEAVRISSRSKNEILNSKSEFKSRN